jgi:predicted DNA binding protein
VPRRPATRAAAVDRLESEASLRVRDAELEARNRRLRRQVQINEIIRSIDRSLIGAANREAIESTVTEHLVGVEDVAFAWIGALDPAGTEVVPRTWAGTGHRYLDAVSLTDDDADPEPAVAAARSESPVAVENVVDRLQGARWGQQALAADFHSVVCVPIAVDEYTYGVLAVYADEPGTFGDLEREVFAELGENIANSINSVQTRAALHTEALQELTLRSGDPDALLARVAEAAAARVDYEGIATQDADETRIFFSAKGDPEAVETALDELVSVRSYRLVDDSDDEGLFEATVTGDVLAARLVRHGASPTVISTTGSEMEATVDVPRSTDVREFVEMVQERYPDAELVARKDVERTGKTSKEVTSSLLAALTDRQREVLRTAYYGGFFEWPRASTGEEVAEMLDVSQPTVNRHLRHGHQRLLAGLFDGDAAR